MKTLIFASALIALGAPAMANDAGQWMDVRNRIALGALPNSAEPIARLQYAKAVCRARTGTEVDGAPMPGFMPCMQSQGFVWLVDTPTQIAARKKAASDAEWRAAGAILGQAAGQIGRAASEAVSPHECSGYTQPGGAFNMQCY